MIVYSLPNLALDDVPIGKNDKFNKLIKKSGEIKEFRFKSKSHVELGSKDNSIDFETSIKLTGARFVVLKDKIALLERALINFMLDTHTNEFQYTEISPPLIVNEELNLSDAFVQLWLPGSAIEGMTDVIFTNAKNPM